MKLKLWFTGDLHPSSIITVDGQLGTGEPAYFIAASILKNINEFDFCVVELENKYAVYIWDQEVHGPLNHVKGPLGPIAEGTCLAESLSQTFGRRFKYIES